MTQPPPWGSHPGDDAYRSGQRDDQPTTEFSRATPPPPPPPAAQQPLPPPPPPSTVTTVGHISTFGSPQPPAQRSKGPLLAAVAVVLVAVLAAVGYWVIRPALDNEPVPSAVGVTTSTTSSAPATLTTPRATTAAPSPTESVPADATPCASRPSSAQLGNAAAGNDVTSCEFAEQVRLAYVNQSTRNRDVTVEASSPVTGRSYRMTCSGDDVVRCTGGNNAVVYLY